MSDASSCIKARGLRKTYGATVALDGLDLQVEAGRILGLIGPNGAGKSTALNAFLGLTPYEGELRVLGKDPWIERNELMADVCFIADVAVSHRVAEHRAQDHHARRDRRGQVDGSVLPQLALYRPEERPGAGQRRGGCGGGFGEGVDGAGHAAAS